jgi:hypothetical protein
MTDTPGPGDIVSLAEGAAINLAVIARSAATRQSSKRP